MRIHSVKLSWTDDGNYANEHFVISITSPEDPNVIFNAANSFSTFNDVYEFDSADVLWLPKGKQLTCTVYAVRNGTCLHDYREPAWIPCSTAGNHTEYNSIVQILKVSVQFIYFRK